MSYKVKANCSEISIVAIITASYQQTQRYEELKEI